MMAEIRVQEKRSSMAWLWILLLALLIAAGVWWWMTSREQASAMDPAPVDITPPVGATAPVPMDTTVFGADPTPFDSTPGAASPVIGDTVGFAPNEGGHDLPVHA
jgi:hypothetical protein